MQIKTIEGLKQFHAENWDVDPMSVIRVIALFQVSSKKNKIEKVRLLFAKPVPSQLSREQVTCISRQRVDCANSYLPDVSDAESLELQLAIWDALLEVGSVYAWIKGVVNLADLLRARQNGLQLGESEYSDEQISAIAEKAKAFISKDFSAFNLQAQIAEYMVIMCLHAPREDVEKAALEKLVDLDNAVQICVALRESDEESVAIRRASIALDYLIKNDQGPLRFYKAFQIGEFMQRYDNNPVIDQVVAYLKENIALDATTADFLFRLGDKGRKALSEIDHPNALLGLRIDNEPIDCLTILFGIRAQKATTGANDFGDIDAKITDGFIALAKGERIWEEVWKNGAGRLFGIFANAANAGFTVEKLIPIVTRMQDTAVTMKRAQADKAAVTRELASIRDNPLGAWFPK